MLKLKILSETESNPQSSYDYANGNYPYYIGPGIFGSGAAEKREFNNLCDRLYMLASDTLSSGINSNIEKTRSEAFERLMKDVHNFANEHGANFNDVLYSMRDSFATRWIGRDQLSQLNGLIANSTFLASKHPDLFQNIKSLMPLQVDVNPEQAQQQQQTIDQLTQNSTDLQSQVDTLTQQNKELLAKISGFETLNKELQDQIAAQGAAQAQAQASLEAAQKQAEAAQSALENATSENAEQLKAAAEKANAALEAEKENYLKLNSTFSETIKQHEDELIKAGIEKAELQEKITELSENLKHFDDMTWWDYIKTGMDKGTKEALASMKEYPWHWAGGAAATILIGYGLYRAARAWRAYRNRKLQELNIEK